MVAEAARRRDLEGTAGACKQLRPRFGSHAHYSRWIILDRWWIGKQAHRLQLVLSLVLERRCRR